MEKKKKDDDFKEVWGKEIHKPNGTTHFPWRKISERWWLIFYDLELMSGELTA